MLWHKRRVLPWLCAPLLGIVLSYAVGAVDFRRQWAILAGADPVLECPKTIQLPEQEIGQTAVARLRLSNRGRADLLIDEVRTNCSCSGLEREADGESARVESLQIKPQEQVELAMRVSARGPIGSSLRNVVTFRTNDPTRPTARIEVVVPRITGGITTVPASVVFANVAVGGSARQTFEVRDTAVRPRKLLRVSSSQPERFGVRLLGPDSGGKKNEQTEGGELLGHVEVLVDAREPGPRDGAVTIELDDPSRPPDSVPVTGRVAPLVEALPSSIELPRHSEAGPLYWAQCICRSTEGKALKLVPQDVPPGISAVISSTPDNPALQTVRIQWDRGVAGDPGPDKKSIVRFRARFGDQETLLEIPVRLHRADGS
jgi:hypothetical protein